MYKCVNILEGIPDQHGVGLLQVPSTEKHEQKCSEGIHPQS